MTCPYSIPYVAFAKMTHADNQSSCTNKHINNLETNRHIRVVHVIANTLFSHTTPRYYMLVHARNNLIVLQKTHFHHRYCLVLAIDQSAQALPDCAQPFSTLKEKSLEDKLLFHPHNILSVQFIKFTYCNDRLSNTTNTHKHTKYDVIVPHLHQLARIPSHH